MQTKVIQMKTVRLADTKNDLTTHIYQLKASAFLKMPRAERL